MGRDKNKAKKHSKKMKGKVAWNKGDFGRKSWHNIEGLNKEKPWNKGLTGTNVGVKNGRWIHDRSKVISNDRKDSTEYVKWRKEVYKRDRWKCKIGNSECCGKIEAHHILPWRDYHNLRYDLNNGITLCHFHHPFGVKKEKEMEALLKNLLSGNEATGSRA